MGERTALARPLGRVGAVMSSSTRWRRPLRERGAGIAAVALALVLLILVLIFGSLAMDRSAARAQRSEQLNAAYQHAASGVAAEESYERQYRLEPGPGPLAEHQVAQQQVRSALAQVSRFGTVQDRQLASLVLAEHAHYVLGAVALFAAVDRHEATADVDAIDVRQVDPIFAAMQSQVHTAAASHETAALGQVTASRRDGQLVLAFDVATLVAGVLLIIAAGIALTRSERRLRAQRDLHRHAALHDTLTGLPNRALFADRTEHALHTARRTGGQIAVMFIDLNRFKDVNDTLGHHYGDLLLSQVAERFLGGVRAGDSVARLGGDEFAVLLLGTSPAEAVAAAQRLTSMLAEPFSVKDISLDVEASIGIALAGPDADVETVLRHADVAMYEAKSQQAPFATYELTHDDNTLARLALLGDLRRAIPNGELVLHYQPKVSASSGELHSVEALVRWQHPTRGLLAPDTFVPLAETTAAIHPLTAEVLRQALMQARRWQARGWTIPVAVNISARSLHDLSFPAQIQRQLDTVGLTGQSLSLELTESAIMSDPGRALHVMQSLHAMGISLSIDDFGTGYSSMAYLRALPVQELKIDRTFVMGLATHQSDTVLVQSAVDLGHNLGLHVVAEGVEDATTQRTLTGMGCDLVQGYHIARPVPAGDFEAWLEQHQSLAPGPR